MRKNIKRIDPRYFMDEKLEELRRHPEEEEEEVEVTVVEPEEEEQEVQARDEVDDIYDAMFDYLESRWLQHLNDPYEKAELIKAVLERYYNDLVGRDQTGIRVSIKGAEYTDPEA